MSLAPIDLLKEIPPFQDALAMTGCLSVRRVSKDLKKLFDIGICRVWTQVKDQTSEDLKFLSIFMDKIEKLHGGGPKEENSLIFFKELNNSLRTTVFKDFVFINPSDRLPTHIKRFHLFGPKYVKNAIPVEIQKKANKIEQLTRTVVNSCSLPLDVPEKLRCMMTLDIMTIPIVDPSHTHIKELWDKIKADVEYKAPMAETSFFHIFDIGIINILPYSSQTGLQQCPSCRHPLQQENLLINGVLQNEILHFLENQCAWRYREVCINCDVGMGNTLGFRCAADWDRTVPFIWTSQGWTGFVPVATEFKLVKAHGQACSNVVWEQREQNRLIPQGLKEQFYTPDDIPSLWI